MPGDDRRRTTGIRLGVGIAVIYVHPDWNLPNLQEVLAKALRTHDEGQAVLPPRDYILRAFEVDPADVRCLIVGQDPYPTPGHAVGLAFSSEGLQIPKSLVNVFKEYSTDLGLPQPTSADLSPWLDQGVLLLNRVLTVQAGKAGSHQGLGWEAITEAAVRQVSQNEHFCAILWGRPAQQLKTIVGEDRCVMSPHPSPLAAYRGFFGSRPFSRANEILRSQGGDPIDWRLDR